MSKISITAVQTDIIWCDKKQNLKKLTELFKTVEATDLILLPETFATGFTFEQQAIEHNTNPIILEWMKQQASSSHAVIAGSVLVAIRGKIANRFYWVWPDGRVEYYDKRHLFRLGNEEQYVIAGRERKIIEIKGVRFLPTVCYDLRFPVWSRNKNDYDVLVNVANWPAVRSEVWHALLQARAIENQTYAIGVNRIGIDANNLDHKGGTTFHSYNGKILNSAHANQQEVVTCAIDLSELRTFRDKFPFYLDADNFTLES